MEINKNPKGMGEEQTRRLKRYLLNSDRFLWGLGNGNHPIGGKLQNRGQKDVYLWLYDKGFREQLINQEGILVGERTYRKDYTSVLNQMVKEYGIRKIIEFVHQQVMEQFGEKNIVELKELWELAEEVKPEAVKDIQYQMIEEEDGKREPVKGGCSFFDIDSRYRGLRWSKFAAIFFEEILPWIKESESGKG